MTPLTPADLTIRTLGARTIESPLNRQFHELGNDHAFYTDDHRIVVDHSLGSLQKLIAEGAELPCFEVAGPRKKLFFQPETTICAIVTCGGLCPGFNDVIRAIVLQAHHRYGVARILGIPFGFEGLIPEYGHHVFNLTPGFVSNIHRFGGTHLGTSRGPQDVKRMVDRLQELGVNILFVIGGDGTQRGGRAIDEEARERGLRLSVVGVPKTIDNDLSATDYTFGFDTAVNIATEAIDRLHTTAESHMRVLVVEVMGRHAGWIALHSGLAGGANVILIPERRFDLDQVCAWVESRFKIRYAPIVVVAEGAMPQDGDMVLKDGTLDSFGHVRLSGIGEWLAKQIEKRTGKEARTTVLGHVQRGGTPSAFDRWLATRFGLHAIDAVRDGDFGTMVALRGTDIVRVPIGDATARIKTVDPELYAEASVFFG